MAWFVYILECADGTLYTGATTDPERRLGEHSSGSGARYTASRLPVAMVHVEEASDRSAALKREHLIKKLPRGRKLELIRARHQLPI
jgi:putative endonuclease